MLRLALPADSRWSPEYQRKLVADIEAEFARLSPYRLVPHGGTAGQVLAKSTARDFEMGWVAAGGGSSGANPTASVGLAAVNGAASTFMRSDAAPPISQSIAPTWTALHIFSAGAQISSLELGHASDTTFTRTAPGVAAIEGERVLTVSKASGTATNQWVRIAQKPDTNGRGGALVRIISNGGNSPPGVLEFYWDTDWSCVTNELRQLLGNSGLNAYVTNIRAVKNATTASYLEMQVVGTSISLDVEVFPVGYDSATVALFETSFTAYTTDCTISTTAISAAKGLFSVSPTGNLYASTATLSAAAPFARFYDSDGATGEKYTELNGDGASWSVNFLDDSAANPITPLAFFRTGTNADSMEVRVDGAYIIATLISLQGAACDIFGAVSLYTMGSPAQITANQNDYAPTGLSTSSQSRISSDAARNITGIANGTTGRVLVLHNVGSFDITLVNESASSTAGNRFSFGADLVLRAGFSCVLTYDNVTGRWRKIAEPPPLAVGVPRRTSGFANGECLAISAGVTLNTSDLSAGKAFSLYNDSASAITITQGTSVTMRQSGTANTGNRTLAARGLAYIWCNSASEAVIDGAIT